MTSTQLLAISKSINTLRDVLFSLDSNVARRDVRRDAFSSAVENAADTFYCGEGCTAAQCQAAARAFLIERGYDVTDVSDYEAYDLAYAYVARGTLEMIIDDPRGYDLALNHHDQKFFRKYL